MQEPSRKAPLFWIISSITLLLISLILGGAMVYRMYFEAPIPEAVAPETDNPAGDIDLEAGDPADAFVDDDMSSAEGADESEERWAAYNSRGIIFEYPESWHIFGNFIYDTPEGEVPDLTLYLNEEPIQSVSPSGGPPLTGDIIIYTFAPGDAFLAPYENMDWETYEESRVMIGGEEFIRLKLVLSDEATMDLAYVPQYQEILFYIGEEIAYGVQYIPLEESEFEDPAWLRIKESLRFTGNPSAVAQ